MEDKQTTVVSETGHFECSKIDFFHCACCKIKNVYTRIYYCDEATKLDSVYLCYRCANEEKQFERYKPLTYTINKIK